MLIEKYISGEIEPNRHTLVFPSTGNFGIGGAWVGPRAGFKSMVILPEGMSRERFEKIEGYGASYIKTHGSESNVKEIYDECKRLMREHPDTVRILNQFSEMGNYRFHYYVTGNTIVELGGGVERSFRRTRHCGVLFGHGQRGHHRRRRSPEAGLSIVSRCWPGASAMSDALQQRLRQPRDPRHR
ncbi:MAG: hypothetical protein KatS3mg052_0377 [Candidatus Roseilinea sp.]|nr:MAG: hypothetical protein KatS3mg052_0377 [Candidatus Roseilinea sp.]